MLPESARKAFLERKLNKWDWIRNESQDSLDFQLANMSPPPEFSVALRRHQVEAFLLCAKQRRFFPMADTGLGKTLLILELIKWCLFAKKAKKAVILVKNRENVYGWLDEAKTHTPSLRIVGITDDMPAEHKRHVIRNGRHSAIVMTYAMFTALLTVPPNQRGKRRWNKRASAKEIDTDKVEEFFGDIDFLCCDESTAIKNSGSLTFLAVLALAQSCDWRFCLAARAFGRNVEDAWSQFFVLDDGATLGKNISTFREVFFTTTRDYFGRFKLVLRPSAKADINRLIKNKSLLWESADCVDLPPKNEYTISCDWSEDAKKQYDKLLNDFRKSDKLTPISFARMRTLASGFFYGSDDDDERIPVELPPYNKITAAVDKLKEIPSDKKVIIAHEFQHTGDRICNALDDNGISYIRMPSKIKDVVKSFKNPKIRVLVMNSNAGAYGLNLQFASYMLIVESPVSYLTHYQLHSRIYRSGQKFSTFIYNFVTKHSIDERVQELQKEGDSLYEMIVRRKIII